MPASTRTPSQPTESSPLLAAIDLGSNSFRLELARLRGDRYERVAYLKSTVRLGAGLDAQGNLVGEPVERALACLRDFSSQLRGFEAQHVRAVATQTLRQAANRNAFLIEAEKALAFPIDVVSGREEARMIFAGVSLLQPSPAPRLVVDIGGRSTELILGRGNIPLETESFPVGSVGLSMQFFGDGRLTPQAFRAAQIAVGAEIEEALGVFDRRLWQEALGSSGTASAVSQVLKASGQTDGRITPRALVWLMEQCLQAGHIDRVTLPGLKEDRRAVMPGGLAILYTLATHFSILELQPTRGALRQGLIVDLWHRLNAESKALPTDTRHRTVKLLQQKFLVDDAQANRVRRMALALWARVGDANPAMREALSWAADLHEMGLAVSHHDHHRHAAYLMAHVDAPGFSQSEQQQLSWLLLGQRGGLKKVMARLDNPAAARQLLCLRLAVIHAHARDSAPQQGLVLDGALGGQRIALSWANRQHRADAAQARTEFLLRQECAQWSRMGGLNVVMVDGD